MQDQANPMASKVTTNLSIDSTLYQEAEKRQINLSQTLESYLAELLRETDPAQAAEEAYPRKVTCIFSNGWSNF